MKKISKKEISEMRNGISFILCETIFNSENGEKWLIQPKCVDKIMKVILHVASILNQCPDCVKKETGIEIMLKDAINFNWKLGRKIKKLESTILSLKKRGNPSE